MVLFVRLFLLRLDAGGEMFVAGEVSGEAAEHEDSGYREGGVPAVVVRDETAGERAGEGTDLDRGREDGEAFGAEEFVSRRVEGADLSGDVAFEKARAEDEAEEGKEEGLLEGHGEVADGHEDGAEDDGVAVAEPAVCDEAAEDGGEVDEASVEAEDAGGEGLGGEGAGEGFDCGAEGGEAGDVGGVRWEEEVVDHEEHEEGAHAVVGEALPGFCEGEIEEAAGVAEVCLYRWPSSMTGVAILALCCLGLSRKRGEEFFEVDCESASVERCDYTGWLTGGVILPGSALDRINHPTVRDAPGVILLTLTEHGTKAVFW